MQLILYSPVGFKLKTGEIKARMEPSPLGLFVTLAAWNEREALYQRAMATAKETNRAQATIIEAQTAVIENYKKLLTPSDPTANGPAVPA